MARGSGRQSLDPFQLRRECRPGFLQVEVGLQRHPEVFAGAERLGQAHRSVHADAALAEGDLVNAPRRHTDRARQAVLADAERKEKLFRQLWIGAFITGFVAAGDAGSKPGLSLRQLGQFVADAVM
jgi:hypothetical protein